MLFLFGTFLTKPNFIFVLVQKTPKHDARNLMIRKLQQMKDLATGFNSATGQVSYFDRDQDSPGQYDMVNLNVSVRNG